MNQYVLEEFGAEMSHSFAQRSCIEDQDCEFGDHLLRLICGRAKGTFLPLELPGNLQAQYYIKHPR